MHISPIHCLPFKANEKKRHFTNRIRVFNANMFCWITTYNQFRSNDANLELNIDTQGKFTKITFTCFQINVILTLMYIRRANTWNAHEISSCKSHMILTWVSPENDMGLFSREVNNFVNYKIQITSIFSNSINIVKKISSKIQNGKSQIIKW